MIGRDQVTITMPPVDCDQIDCSSFFFCSASLRDVFLLRKREEEEDKLLYVIVGKSVAINELSIDLLIKNLISLIFVARPLSSILLAHNRGAPTAREIYYSFTKNPSISSIFFRRTLPDFEVELTQFAAALALAVHFSGDAGDRQRDVTFH